MYLDRGMVFKITKKPEYKATVRIFKNTLGARWEALAQGAGFSRV
jgi:hypothetical protein